MNHNHLNNLNFTIMELCLQHNQICVYKLNDWKKLRTEYRIVGEYLGSTQTTPTLPIKLLPEEVLLLINKNIAQVVQYPDLYKESTDQNVKEYKKLQNELQEAEQTVYKQYRKNELEPYIDKIIEAKRQKLNVDCVSHTSVLNEELSKVTVSQDNMVWPILTESLDCVKGQSIVTPHILMEQTTPTKVAVFADLWEKGYYVTCGKKFGGDFLVYAGDPIAFHAIHIIRCVEDSSKPLHTTEIIAFGRLGTSVKKKSVLATYTNVTVNYITINWLDL